MCNTKDIRDFDSFYELIEFFNTEEKCVDYLAKVRWNGQPQCQYCGHEECYVLNVKGRGKRWKCKECKKQFSVRVGTIFEESKLSLRKWFIAIYLVTAHKKGISSHQLARDLKITQKAAWFVLHRIRVGYTPKHEKFDSAVEIDESYVGGKERNKHRSKRTGGTQGRSIKSKKPILGIFQRDGKVFAIPVADTKATTILPIMRERVEAGTTVYTDEYNAYRSLRRDFDHQIVNHSAEEFVRGSVSTNSIESFWATIKRGYIGVYHHWSDQHIGRYINEFPFRFNNRNLSEGSKFGVLLGNVSGRLDYKTLISEGKKEA
jgi:transposase-like protein